MNIINFIKCIKESNLQNKKEYIEDVKKSMDAFVSYFNTVVDMEIYSETVSSWTPMVEMIFKNKDEERRNQHNICISYCNKLNKIAELLDYDFYIDTENRHEVACLIGDIINSIYSKGINRTFDELVMDYSKSGRTLNNIDLEDI